MAPTGTPLKPIGGYNRTAKKIMWLGVVSLSLIIIILWGWAFKLRLALVHFAKSPEGELVQKTKTDWDQAFATEHKKTTAQKANLQQELKTILNQIIANAVPGATTTQNSTTSTP
ncbi:MAG: hypothetical protein HY983_02580 [Candidatus Magasanikbacteria bacterium]|nr:hypothetical protein [Candidatus Magasanikbacteria bacterium]